MVKCILRPTTKLVDQRGWLDEVLVEIVEESSRHPVSIGDGQRANLRKELVWVCGLVHLIKHNAGSGSAQFEGGRVEPGQPPVVVAVSGWRARCEVFRTALRL